MKKHQLSEQLSSDPRLKMVRQVTKLMDEQFAIGRFRFGLDPILGLIPVVGDVGAYVISATLVITMIRHGTSGRVAAKMLWNITLDALVGAIPLVGAVFDFAYKANTRNLKLLTEHYTEGKHQGSAKPVVLSIILTMLLILALLIYLSIKALLWMDSKLSPLILK